MVEEPQMSAIDLTATRLKPEERFMQYPYNDRTGKRVSCITSDPATTGNLSWLYGLNLETEGTPELGELVLHWKLGKLEASLQGFAWYSKCNDVRKSALLDMAFNEGVHGLLHFPHMLSAIATDDWATAKAECKVTDPRLAGRYAVLADLLFRGES